jgi:HEAT repeat protein
LMLVPKITSTRLKTLRWRGFFFALGPLALLLFLPAGEGRAALPAQDRLTPAQREIERQRQRLSSSEVEERRDALMRLGNLKRSEASRAAAAALNDAAPIVRVTAAHAILSLPSSEAASLLAPLLKDKSEFVRREAASVLGQTHDRAAINALSEALLKDKKSSVRGAAAIALGEIGDETAVTALSQALTGGKKKRSSEDEFVVRSAAKSLGQIRSRAGVPVLIATLENSSNAPDTRREAATALGLIGDPAAMPALQAAFAGGEDPYLAEAAHAAMRRIRSPSSNR